MSDKLQFSINGDKITSGIDERLGSKEVVGEYFIPINPETNEPYFHSIFEENDAVWAGRKVTPIPNSAFGGDDE